MRLASFLLDGDKCPAPRDLAPLAVDVDIPAKGVTLAPLGRLSHRGKARSLRAHGVLTHLVQDVDVIGQLVTLAPERLSQYLAERCVLSARRLAAGVVCLAHAAEAAGVAAGEVVQAVLHSRSVVDEARALSTAVLATPLSVGVDVVGFFVRGAPMQRTTEINVGAATQSCL